MQVLRKNTTNLTKTERCMLTLKAIVPCCMSALQCASTLHWAMVRCYADQYEKYKWRFVANHRLLTMSAASERA